MVPGTKFCHFVGAPRGFAHGSPTFLQGPLASTGACGARAGSATWLQWPPVAGDWLFENLLAHLDTQKIGEIATSKWDKMSNYHESWYFITIILHSSLPMIAKQSKHDLTPWYPNVEHFWAIAKWRALDVARWCSLTEMPPPNRQWVFLPQLLKGTGGSQTPGMTWF